MEAVRRFLAEHVTTYTELDTLLLLHKWPAREFSIAEVCEALRSTVEHVDPALQNLCQRGLAKRRQQEATRFRYAPSSEELNHAVQALDVAYDDQRWLVVEIMTRNALDRLRSAAKRLFLGSGRRE